MTNYSWPTRKPIPDRRKRGDDQGKITRERKRYLKSVRYCQRCGKGVYPGSLESIMDKGEDKLYEVVDKMKGKLMICKKCYENNKRVD